MFQARHGTADERRCPTDDATFVARCTSPPAANSWRRIESRPALAASHTALRPRYIVVLGDAERERVDTESQALGLAPAVSSVRAMKKFLTSTASASGVVPHYASRFRHGNPSCSCDTVSCLLTSAPAATNRSTILALRWRTHSSNGVMPY